VLLISPSDISDISSVSPVCSQRPGTCPVGGEVTWHRGLDGWVVRWTSEPAIARADAAKALDGSPDGPTVSHFVYPESAFSGYEDILDGIGSGREARSNR
jgi:hypothetical protein